MSAEQLLGSRVDRTRRRRRPGAPRSRSRRPRAGTISAFQRSRLLAAALAEASEGGRARTPVARIVARAGVSRKTFYDHFASREDCFRAVFEQALAEIAEVLAPVYGDGEGDWLHRLRAALVELVGFLERERDAAAFVLGYLVEESTEDPGSRTLVLERLREIVDQGRSQVGARRKPPPLAAEMVVGGALAVMHERSRTRSWDLTGLVNQLMWMIALPYLGPTAAARELRRTPPSRAVTTTASSRSEEGPLAGLRMRVTYRTGRVLAAVAEAPGCSNMDICAAAEIADQGQTSRLLIRLAGLGLVQNLGPGWQFGRANSWHLTQRGEQVETALSAQLTVHGLPRSGR